MRSAGIGVRLVIVWAGLSLAGACNKEDLPRTGMISADAGTPVGDLASVPPEDAGAAGTAADMAGPTSGSDAQAPAPPGTDGGAVEPPPPPVDAAPAPPRDNPVFALDRLHTISIEVDAAHIATLNDDNNEARVPAVITYDGVALPGSGIRKKGWTGSRRALFDKTGFTIDFHEFAPKQRLHGLKKLTLNNSVQDASFLHEHLAYEIYRRAGQPAPFTAHGLVTFNGMPFGIYVIKEHVDGEFLDRNYGEDNDQGNLYEGPCCHDFAISPEKIELKDEVQEMRSRQDLLEVAALIRDTPDAQFEAVVGARVDLDSFIASYALDAIIDHFDDYVWNGNNYYLYHHPGSNKFVFIPHGADQALWSLRDPLRAPEGLLARRVRALPALDARFQQALKRYMAEVYDLPALNARIDQAAAIMLAAPAGDARTAGELQSVRDNVPMLKHMLTRRQAWAARLNGTSQ